MATQALTRSCINVTRSSVLALIERLADQKSCAFQVSCARAEDSESPKPNPLIAGWEEVGKLKNYKRERHHQQKTAKSILIVCNNFLSKRVAHRIGIDQCERHKNSTVECHRLCMLLCQFCTMIGDVVENPNSQCPKATGRLIFQRQNPLDLHPFTFLFVTKRSGPQQPRVSHR